MPIVARLDAEIDVRVLRVQEIALRRNGRVQRAFSDANGVLRDVDVIGRAEHGRVFPSRHGKRLLARHRQQPVDRPRRKQTSRRDPDDLLVTSKRSGGPRRDDGARGHCGALGNGRALY